MKLKIISFLLLIFIMNYNISLYSETERTPQGVYIEQKLNQSIDLSLTFLNEEGKPVTLGEYFNNKPVIIAPAYFECPRLCTLIYNGLLDVMETTKFLKPGKDYIILSISFNPSEKPELAKEKAMNYRKQFKNFEIQNADWVFLVAHPEYPENPKILLNSMGYNYKKDGNDFSHPAAIIFLTPDGRVSKYLYGIEFLSRDFRFALMEASEGRIGTPVDAILMKCFRYDSIQGKYAPFAWGFMRLGGILILILILSLVSILIFLEKKSKKQNLNLN